MLFLNSISPIWIWSVIGLTIVLTVLFIRRFQSKGCFSYAYIGAVIFCILIFGCTSWMFFVKANKDIWKAISIKNTYQAEVISLETSRHYDDDNHRYYNMYTPTVVFQTISGKHIEKQLNFATTNINIGDKYDVKYDEETGSLVTLNYLLIVTWVGTFLFVFIFTFLIVGIILFAKGTSMDRYIHWVKVCGFYFLIPFMMIVFDALMIFGLFRGNVDKLWVKAVLIFFIFVLSLGIIGYIKMMYKKGLPIMTRVGTGRWVGNWK